MNEDQRLRVQIYTNLSLGLIAAAFATIGVFAGAYMVIAGNIPVIYRIIVGIVDLAAISSLIASIYFGGKGISAAHDNILQSPFPDDTYHEGKFDWQAITGLIGLLLGVLIFVIIGIIGPFQEEKQPEIKGLQSDLQKAEVAIQRLKDEIISIKVEQKKTDIAPDKDMKNRPTEMKPQEMPEKSPQK